MGTLWFVIWRGKQARGGFRGCGGGTGARGRGEGLGGRESEGAWGGCVDHRDNAPASFADDLAAALVLICRDPNIGVSMPAMKRRGVRRITIERVHYYVYYQVTAESVVVLSVWHAARGTSPRV